MALPCPQPELTDDATAEILRLVPPDEPADLVCASFVNKCWRRVLTNPDFLHQYRRLHGPPPLLGFFHSFGFVPTTAASPFHQAQADLLCPPWLALDCRHGRVLLHIIKTGKFIVWDPITGHQKELPEPKILGKWYSVAVLCAASGCDHRNCHGGPFLVVFVVTDTDDTFALACVYSSETDTWGKQVSVHIDEHGVVKVNYCRGALVGDGVHFMLSLGAGILKYDLGKHCLSVMALPDPCYGSVLLMATKDGMLGLANTLGSSLYLWSREVNTEVDEGWVQYRELELQKLLPVEKPLNQALVVGFAEGADVIFLSTDVGAFVIDLKSGQARKISEFKNFSSVVPFMTFCTPDSDCVKGFCSMERHINSH